MLVEVALLDIALLQTLAERHKHLATLQVGTVQHSIHRGGQTILVRLVLTLVEEVVDGVAVRQNDGIIAPLIAEDVDQQTVTRTTGFPLEPLVGAHHLPHVSLLYQRLEGGQIGFPEVSVRRLHIH